MRHDKIYYMNEDICDDARAIARKKFENLYRKAELKFNQELEEIKDNAEFEIVLAKIICAELDNTRREVNLLFDRCDYIVSKLKSNGFNVSYYPFKGRDGRYLVSWDENSPAMDLIIEYHEKLGLSSEDLKEVCTKIKEAMKIAAKTLQSSVQVDITEFRYCKDEVVISQIRRYFKKLGLYVNVKIMDSNIKKNCLVTWSYIEKPHYKVME